ncbi:MAG TPA: riboflavin synthase [Polyangia bacterium]|jgi:riboflavin synthase|nr:riboflavin synthase [Polyangia bacterium]
MFTGLVEDVGTIRQVETLGSGGQGARRLTVATRLADEEMPIGASLAVDGTCLTVVTWSRGQVALVAAAETLACTTLGQLAAGDHVNLERPLRVGDRLGGHMVAGHVDGIGRIAGHGRRGEALDVRVSCPGPLLRYVVAKGSIAIDGISLTVNTVDEGGFSVSLIPHTQAVTTLAQKAPGAAVNLEVDMIGKYVEKLLEGYRGGAGLTLEKLKENGFLSS